MTIGHLEAYNSLAIEGNALILREVEVLLDTDRAVGAKELGGYLKVAGYAGCEMGLYRGLDRAARLYQANPILSRLDKIR
jgi:hypothetical protein